MSIRVAVGSDGFVCGVRLFCGLQGKLVEPNHASSTAAAVSTWSPQPP
jgi:hypothetical protein